MCPKRETCPLLSRIPEMKSIKYVNNVKKWKWTNEFNETNELNEQSLYQNLLTLKFKHLLKPGQHETMKLRPEPNITYSTPVCARPLYGHFCMEPPKFKSSSRHTRQCMWCGCCLIQFPCSPTSTDYSYTAKLVLHLQIYDETSCNKNGARMVYFWW